MRYPKVIHCSHAEISIKDCRYCRTLLFQVTGNVKLEYQLQELIRRHHNEYMLKAKIPEGIWLAQNISDYEIVLDFLPNDKKVNDFVTLLEHFLA